ncbi:hypothetical protein H4R34_002915 [Dimargaris verticillata]|uniref:Methylated-DNA--protein-cysteine methyltransferase n=1 Tax=Dimargaris verticillata TaxID=2761393 RepID=A0A9W8B8J2_9FUNG|nr:hypothetical protein H4R34_002915 [Dimargaris verticillata]
MAASATGLLSQPAKPFPHTVTERQQFVNYKTQRPVTEFQFRVYDLCAQVPSGQFTTYKLIATALNSHPRAVGQALRVNPFAPAPVPCHRVMASNFYVGGFDGDWGCGQVHSKKELLKQEGIEFDANDYIAPAHRTVALFQDFVVKE